MSNGHHRLAVSLTLSPQSVEISREGLGPSDYVLSKDEKDATQVGISSLGYSTSPANLARFIDGGGKPRIGDQLFGTHKTWFRG